MLIINNDEVQQATLAFIDNGYFVSEQERQPIEADD